MNEAAPAQVNVVTEGSLICLALDFRVKRESKHIALADTLASYDCPLLSLWFSINTEEIWASHISLVPFAHSLPPSLNPFYCLDFHIIKHTILASFLAYLI